MFISKLAKLSRKVQILMNVKIFLIFFLRKEICRLCIHFALYSQYRLRLAVEKFE